MIGPDRRLPEAGREVDNLAVVLEERGHLLHGRPDVRNVVEGLVGEDIVELLLRLPLVKIVGDELGVDNAVPIGDRFGDLD